MMFHSSHIHMPNRHRQRTAMRTFFPFSSFSPPDSKEPLRRGILFSSVATILLLVGTILTWLGFNDVFGGKISMTGPLLIALALLMLLLSLRQFMLARKRNRTANGPVQMETMNTSGVTAVVVDHDDGTGAATIVVETWDSEEPNHNVTRCWPGVPDAYDFSDQYSNRSWPSLNNCDLAPPPYMDIAHSCSSNCPSFISHEDHNEAPPTYEETCGGISLYHSETSLNTVGSHGGSGQLDGSPSPRRTSQPGQSFFQYNHPLNMNKSDHNGTSESCRSSIALGPLTTIATNQCLGNQVAASDYGKCSLAQQPVVDPTAKSNTAQSVTHDPEVDKSVPSVPMALPGVAITKSTESEEAEDKPSQWSRRSFSSIPSYTCLLSESGEVSSQVFNTSSIIEEMMPSLAVQGRGRESTSPDLLTGTTAIPTRSHSLSSVNTLRQGVPYNLSPSIPSVPGHQATRLPNQPGHGQQSVSAGQSPESVSNSIISSSMPRSPSFPHQGPRPRQGSDSNLMEMLAIHPPLGTTLISVQPQTSQQEACQGEQLSQSAAAASETASSGSAERNLMTSSWDKSLSQGKLFNTQDVQETI